MGYHFLLQGIFPTQGWNLCLLHWQADSLPLSHLGRRRTGQQGLYHLALGGEAICSWESESEVPQLCPTLCDPMDCSIPGSSVHGIFRARVLEWVAMPFSRVSSQPRDQTQVSCIAGRLFIILATPWTAAHQAPPSMGFSRQECWSGVPLPSH